MFPLITIIDADSFISISNNIIFCKINNNTRLKNLQKYKIEKSKSTMFLNPLKYSIVLLYMSQLTQEEKTQVSNILDEIK